MNSCLTDGAVDLRLTVTDSGELAVEQTVRFQDIKALKLPPFHRPWVQHGVQAQQLIFSDLTYRNDDGNTKREDLRFRTTYRPYSDVLRVRAINVTLQTFNEGEYRVMTVKYIPRLEKTDGDRASFQLSLDIPTEVVDWDGLSYTRTRCFCNADEIPLTLSLSAPTAVKPGDVAITSSHGSRLALEARPGGSRRFWRLKKDVKLDERDPLLLWLSLPHRHVTGARSRSPSQEILAWFYPDRSFVSVVLRVLVSLLLLVGLASITRRSDAARRSGANITARGGKLRRTYLFLRVGAGNLALLAPLLLESLGLFHLQRFGLIEWSIVAVNGAFDLLAVGVILAVVVDRYLVAFLRRVDKGWPRRLFDQLLYASHSGRSARELELLATAHLVLRNGDVLPDSLTAEQVLAHLDQAAAHHLAPGDIAVVAQLRSTPRGELSLQVPLINRVLRLQAASRQVGAIQRQADAAFEEAMEKLGRSPAYRASRERNGDAFVNVVRQELIWLLAAPGAAKHLGGQLHQLEHVAGLSIEPLRGLRALVDGLVPR